MTDLGAELIALGAHEHAVRWQGRPLSVIRVEPVLQVRWDLDPAFDDESSEEQHQNRS